MKAYQFRPEMKKVFFPGIEASDKYFRVAPTARLSGLPSFSEATRGSVGNAEHRPNASNIIQPEIQPWPSSRGAAAQGQVMKKALVPAAPWRSSLSLVMPPPEDQQSRAERLMNKKGCPCQARGFRPFTSPRGR
eukprot:TRINITY_DN28915_c0_g4_i1.p1 TRINITY_DN28915_c0_g4~~TRINITY_DN28915_c0_g4_i1.p1  ORF type:complete len:134 (-),score=11.79 TRINITY_DN28915_c0_g4_i1:55-456(-)